MVVEGAHSACVGNLALLVDDVDALGPGGVGVVRGVGHVVDAERNRIFLALDEVVGDGDALFESFGLRVADVFFDVGLHLPFVGGMRFAHVDGQKVSVILIVVVDLNDIADLATEWRSSVATEDDHQRASADAIVNSELLFAVECEQGSVWGGVTWLEFAAMHMRQGVAEHSVGVLRAACHYREADEGCDQEHADNCGDPYPDSFHRATFPESFRRHSTRSEVGRNSREALPQAEPASIRTGLLSNPVGRITGGAAARCNGDSVRHVYWDDRVVD